MYTQKNAGDKLYITINRGGRELKVEVKLEKAPLASVEKLALGKAWTVCARFNTTACKTIKFVVGKEWRIDFWGTKKQSSSRGWY